MGTDVWIDARELRDGDLLKIGRSFYPVSDVCTPLDYPDSMLIWFTLGGVHSDVRLPRNLSVQVLRGEAPAKKKPDQVFEEIIIPACKMRPGDRIDIGGSGGWLVEKVEPKGADETRVTLAGTLKMEFVASNIIDFAITRETPLDEKLAEALAEARYKRGQWSVGWDEASSDARGWCLEDARAVLEAMEALK